MFAKMGKFVGNHIYSFDWWLFYMHSNKVNVFECPDSIADFGSRAHSNTVLLYSSCWGFRFAFTISMCSIFDVTFTQFLYHCIAPNRLRTLVLHKKKCAHTRKSKWENVRAFHVRNSYKLIIIFLFRFRNGNFSWHVNLSPIFRSFVKCTFVVCICKHFC